MNSTRAKNIKKERRRLRSRAKIFGTAERPRLSVFRSNHSTYAQLIDDASHHTLCSASTRAVTGERAKKTEMAKRLGALIAEKALQLHIKKAVFHRGMYAYHGR